MDKTEKAITFDNLPRRLPHREADGNVQKNSVYFQNCLCALMGKIVEIYSPSAFSMASMASVLFYFSDADGEGHADAVQQTRFQINIAIFVEIILPL